MKFVRQVVLPIAILLGVIALVTYVAHFRGAAIRDYTPASAPVSSP
jgi:hypothetical protein